MFGSLYFVMTLVAIENPPDRKLVNDTSGLKFNKNIIGYVRYSSHVQYRAVGRSENPGGGGKE